MWNIGKGVLRNTRCNLLRFFLLRFKEFLAWGKKGVEGLGRWFTSVLMHKPQNL